MTIDLKPEHKRVTERAIHLGICHDSNEVVSAALEMLAEDLDDVAVSNTREHELRSTLEEVEAQLRALSK